MAAMMMEAAAGDIEFKDGAFRIVGTDRAHAAHRRRARRSIARRCCRRNSTSASKPPARSRPSRRIIPNGCHVCEVEVDPETGVVTLARYAAVDDVGKVMNHLLCEGQIHGGVAQGVGQALMEAIVFDAEGQLVTGSFQDYAMPRAEDFPDLVSELTEVPAKTNPLGVKGAGEAGATGAPPAVIGAILDALQTARHRSHRHAGDAEPGLGGDQRAGKRKSGGVIFTSPQRGERRRPSDAVLKVKNADPKDRLCEQSERG